MKPRPTANAMERYLEEATKYLDPDIAINFSKRINEINRRSQETAQSDWKYYDELLTPTKKFNPCSYCGQEIRDPNDFIIHTRECLNKQLQNEKNDEASRKVREDDAKVLKEYLKNSLL